MKYCFDIPSFCSLSIKMMLYSFEVFIYFESLFIQKSHLTDNGKQRSWQKTSLQWAWSFRYVFLVMILWSFNPWPRNLWDQKVEAYGSCICLPENRHSTQPQVYRRRASRSDSLGKLMERIHLWVCSQADLRLLITNGMVRSRKRSVGGRGWNQGPGAGVAGSPCINILRVITNLYLSV